MDSENLQKEFKVFNISIESLSVFYGIFLIGWGVVISLISGSSSLTSYIPSFLGVPLFIFSYLAIKFPSKKKTIYAYCCYFWSCNFSWWTGFYKNISGWCCF